MDGSRERPRRQPDWISATSTPTCASSTRQSGEVIEEGRLRTTPEAFRRRFASERPCASP